MCFDSFLVMKVHGPCFKIAFHDTEAFLDFPTSFIDFYNGQRVSFKIGADSIKTVVHGFCIYSVNIDVVCGCVSNFAISGNVSNSSFCVSLSK